MHRFRLFLACLLLLTLPLQGMAAALKLSCLAHESGAAVASHVHADGAAHHHSGDSAVKHASHHTDAGCSACAACCHGAIANDAATVPTFSAPSCVVATPLAVAMRLRATPPPDKPPRA